MTFDDDDDADARGPILNAEVGLGSPQVEAIPDDDPDAEPEPAAERPKKGSKALQERFSQLTSRLGAERAARALAERRAAAAHAIMHRMGQAAPAAPISPADLERLVEGRVARRLAAHVFNARSNAVHAAGVQAFPDFEDRIGRLQQMGVLHPHDPRLLAAVLETEAPEVVLHQLGGDPQAALQVAQLPPVRQAAVLARLAMRGGQPGARPVSRAPAPISPIGGATARRFDPTDESVPIEDWVREMDKRDQARRARG
jgi:hypothetical protein